MPKTIITCSIPGCKEVAVTKVAVPWHYGPIEEPKTYGYACAAHVDAVVARAQERLDSSHLIPEESVGELATFALRF